MRSHLELQAAYDTTRPYKEGKKELPPIFKSLASWVYEHYDISIINIVYQAPTASTDPRMRIVVDTAEDWALICDKNAHAKWDFRKFIVNTFEALIKQTKAEYTSSKLQLQVEAFSNLAFYLASTQLLRHQKITLLQHLSAYNIYDVISREDNTLLVFYTEENLERSKTSGQQEKIKKVLQKQLKEYDEFGYFKSITAINVKFAGGVEWEEQPETDVGSGLLQFDDSDAASSYSATTRLSSGFPKRLN